MSRIRSRALVVAGLSSLLPSLAIGDTTSATTQPDEASDTTSPSTSPADPELEAPAAPISLMGSSYGAFIVNAYASMHPDRVAAVLMISHPIRTDWWEAEVWPLVSAEQQEADRLWSDGTTNLEHMDSYSMTEVISTAGPLAMPYTVLIPTEPGQCAVAGVCGEMYDAYVPLARRLADESPSGRFRIIDGAHDLYVTHLDDVVEEIDLLAAQLN